MKLHGGRSIGSEKKSEFWRLYTAVKSLAFINVLLNEMMMSEID